MSRKITPAQMRAVRALADGHTRGVRPQTVRALRDRGYIHAHRLELTEMGYLMAGIDQARTKVFNLVDALNGIHGVTVRVGGMSFTVGKVGK